MHSIVRLFFKIMIFCSSFLSFPLKDLMSHGIFLRKEETYHHTIGSKANMEYLSIMEIFAHELDLYTKSVSIFQTISSIFSFINKSLSNMTLKNPEPKFTEAKQIHKNGQREHQPADYLHILLFNFLSCSIKETLGNKHNVVVLQNPTS